MSTNPPIPGRIADYHPRLVDAELIRRLRATGAVLIEGPRGCGKTQTGLRLASSAVRLDRDRAARAAGELNPMLLLEGAKPRLIDEWQLVKEVWNEVSGDVDDHPGEMGRYVLAGSAVPSDDETRHTGSMRITRVKIGTDQADAAGVQCYLETGTDENVAFCRKRGFEVSGQTEFEGYPVYGMIRQPQQPG